MNAIKKAWQRLCSAAFVLCCVGTGAPALGQAASASIAKAELLQVCSAQGCESVKPPAELGRIKSVQSWPIAKASRVAALVSGTKGHAVCAAPVWGGPIKCIGINFPSVAQVKFRIVNRSGNGYSIRAYARTGEATKPAIKALTRQFIHEFRRSKDLLDQRIEYTRPPTRSANRSQIDLDARSGMVMLAGGDLECESDDCVVIEGPGAGDDPGDEEDPREDEGDPRDESDRQDEPIERPEPDPCSPSSGSPVNGQRAATTANQQCPDPQKAKEKCLDDSYLLYLDEVAECKKLFAGESYEMSRKRAECYGFSTYEYGERNKVCHQIN